MAYLNPKTFILPESITEHPEFEAFKEEFESLGYEIIIQKGFEAGDLLNIPWQLCEWDKKKDIVLPWKNVPKKGKFKKD